MSESTPEHQPDPDEQATPGGTQQGSSADGGLDPKVGGLLSYLLFGWIGGLIMLLTQKHPEVRFHGAQSILVSIALFALYVVLWIVGIIVSFVPGIGFIGAILLFLVNLVVPLAALALWVLLCIKGYNLEHFKLPVLGNYAEKWAAG